MCVTGFFIFLDKLLTRTLKQSTIEWLYLIPLGYFKKGPSSVRIDLLNSRERGDGNPNAANKPLRLNQITNLSF